MVTITAGSELWGLLLDPAIKTVLESYRLPLDHASRRLTLEEACAKRGVALPEILMALHEAEERAARLEQSVWLRESLRLGETG